MERRLPRLHLVTDDRLVGAPGFERRAAALLDAGGSRVALHLRAPAAGGRRLYEIGAALVPEARTAGALVLVNDRLDVALACGADGVQLGARAIGIPLARELVARAPSVAGAHPLVGASVHGVAEARAAAAAGADFLLVGTLYATPSHPGRSGSGTRVLRDLRELGAPCIGIGGITPARVEEVREAGGWGVAVVRGVWDAVDAEAALHEYLRVMEGEDG